MNIVLPLLGAVLIVLKAMGYISLPWLWVLAPFWVGLLLSVIFLLLAPRILRSWINKLDRF